VDVIKATLAVVAVAAVACKLCINFLICQVLRP
jgi:hypothetical protein